MKLYKLILFLLAMQFASSVSAQVYCGDINHDGVVDMADVSSLVNVILGKEEKEIYKIQGDSLVTANHDYVDLGLPSGTLWSTCNIGAEKPEDSGLYFAWGETKGYTSNIGDGHSFDETTYKYYDGIYTYSTKYCTTSNYGKVDYKASLEAMDDAATVNWGSKWRMPSSEQVAELSNKEYTSSKWTTRNGIYGMLITSKSNGKSIFLPASGYRYHDNKNQEGYSGHYWTRNLRDEIPGDAYKLILCQSYIESGEYEYNERCEGLTIRPVLVGKDSNLLPGKFTVNAEGKQVQFTKSNLYWNGTKYQFEESQTEYEGVWDETHVGHFYWTNITDYNSGNSDYVPFSRVHGFTSQSTTDELFCSENNPLVVEGTDGLYALTGGTNGEWNYLLFTRDNARSLYKSGVKVTSENSVRENCLILAPDNFTDELKTEYTLDEINSIGLVCLPAAGMRYGNSYSNVGTEGVYWTATSNKGYWTAAWCIEYDNSGLDVQQYYNKSQAQSIRLVKTVSE